MPRWLILAPRYNCDGRAASQTVTDKVSLLRKAGVELEVISTWAGQRDSTLPHHQVWPWGPSGLRFDFRHHVAQRHGRGGAYLLRTTAMSLALAPLVAIERVAWGLPGHWSWGPAAARRAVRLHNRRPFDLIYSSGGPDSAHLAGYLAHRGTGVPWVAEVHDPIVKPWERATLSGWRSRRKEQAVEQLICRHAAAAWWFTDAALAAATLRNPELGNRGFTVLPGAAPPVTRADHAYGSHMRLGHFGVLAQDRSLADFFRGLDIFLRRHPSARQQVQIDVYGCSLDSASRAALDRLGLASLVIEHGRVEGDPHTGRSGRDLVNEQMQLCDALLLLHGNTPQCAQYIPSKFYEYLWARRPILAMVHNNEQLERLARQHGSFLAPATDPAGIAAAIEDIWSAWMTKRLDTPSAPPLGVDQAVAEILSRLRTLAPSAV